MKRAALAVLAAAVVAGCGGSEDGDRGGGSAARAAYVERSDALCRESARFVREELNPEYREVDERVQESGDERRFLDRYTELLERDTDQLEQHTERFAALEPPAESEDTHDAIVRDLRRQVVLSRDLVEAQRNGDVDRAEALSRELDDIERRLERIVREYGFVDCADPGGDAGLNPRAKYIADGDALCRSEDRDQRQNDPKFDELDAEARRSGDYARATEGYRELLEAETIRFEEHVESFAALKPPAGSEDAHDEFVRGLRQQLVLLRRQLTAFTADDFDRAEAVLQERQDAEKRLDTILRRYGFTVCSSPG